ncbi:anti-sigma factor [Egicoccus sp. AB-alg2]|uniref:anti-sigma factor n=1 Tax=Egicoccus sp. AB-alg2 TaxID=3242693 RepID=UPI00359CD901
MSRGCPDRLGDLGAYVLDGLAPEERIGVEAHLAHCPGCRAELAELQPLPHLLALAENAPPPPPADLRHRALAAARPRPRVRWPAAAVLVFVAVLGGATVAGLDDTTTPDGLTVAVPAEPAVGVVGEANLAQVTSGVQLHLDLRGLQPADDGYYHAWLTRGDRRVSAGTFVAGDGGHATARLQCGGRLEDYDALLVTWHGRGSPDEVVAVEQPLPDATAARAPDAEGGW